EQRMDIVRSHIALLGPRRGFPHEEGTFEQLERHVIPRGRLETHVALPGEETIDPCHYLVLVPSHSGDDETGGPLVCSRRDEDHGGLSTRFATRDSGLGTRDSVESRLLESRIPIPESRLPVAQYHGDNVVAVGKDIRCHF